VSFSSTSAQGRKLAIVKAERWRSSSMGNLSSKAPRIGAPRAATTASPQFQKNACERLPREGARSFDYACEYIKMGPGRSIEKVAQKFGKKARPLKKYSRKWKWVKRAAAYDRLVDAQNLKAAEAFAKAEAQKWAQRERDYRERQLLRCDRLIEAIESTLRLPLAEVTTMTQIEADGHEIQIQVIKPIVSLRDGLSFVVTGVALQGQAIRNEFAPHSDVADVEVDECGAPQIAADPKRAWARSHGEPARAYSYASEYFTMGPHRSIAKVAKKIGKHERPLKRYSRKWRWVKRAVAYDRSIEAEKREEAGAFAKAAEQESSTQRERLFLLGEQLIEMGNAIFKLPLGEVRRVTQVDANGRATQMQMIKPVCWAIRDAVPFLMIGSALGDQAIRNEETPIKWTGPLYQLCRRAGRPRRVSHLIAGDCGGFSMSWALPGAGLAHHGSRPAQVGFESRERSESPLVSRDTRVAITSEVFDLKPTSACASGFKKTIRETQRATA
jgi:hypothetical protein